MDKEQLKNKIGQRIVELRSQKGWSQSDLARACAKDRQAIEKLENISHKKKTSRSPSYRSLL